MRFFASIESQYNDLNIDNSDISSFYLNITKLLLRVTAYFIVPLMFAGSYYFFKNMSLIHGFTEILFGIFLLFIVYANIFTPKRKRFFILFIYYLISVLLLVITGNTGAGLVSIMTTVAFTALLTRGRKELTNFFLFNVLVFVVLTIGLYTGLMDTFLISDYKDTWPIVASVMLVFSFSIVYAIEYYKDSLISLFSKAELNYKYLDNTINSIDSIIFAVDNNGEITFFNEKIRELTRFDDLEGEDYEELFQMFLQLQTDVGKAIKDYKHISVDAFSDGIFYYEMFGEVHYVTRNVFKMKDEEGKVIVIRDITKRIEREQQLQYLTIHDELTGVYNRKHFNSVVSLLEAEGVYPLAMMIVDLNGLNLINESFGYKVGDIFLKKTAEIFDDCVEEEVYRIGGDEFALIMPGSNIEKIKEVEQCLKEKIEKVSVNNLEISISTGISERRDSVENLSKVIKRMDDELGTAKLSESSSMRSKTINLILDTLYEKNQREMAHSKRVSTISKKLAEALKLDSAMVSRLELSGLMHDIGKIGIEENILNKKERLLDEEWRKIQKHPEIGYRILSSHNEFADIANFILEHHERYDGKGYPNGLVGDDIEFGARIVAVADAYDAMTGPRTYRASLSKEDAIEELIKGKGTQFDPEIVDIFINSVVNDL